MKLFPQKTYSVSDEIASIFVRTFNEELKTHRSKNLMFFNSFYPDYYIISHGAITHIIFSVKKSTKSVFIIINIFLLLIQILILFMCGKNILPTYLLPMLISLLSYTLLRFGFTYQVQKLQKTLGVRL